MQDLGKSNYTDIQSCNTKNDCVAKYKAVGVGTSQPYKKQSFLVNKNTNLYNQAKEQHVAKIPIRDIEPNNSAIYNKILDEKCKEMIDLDIHKKE